MSRKMAFPGDKRNKRRDVPENMPPSPPMRHRLIRDMEAVGEAKAEQASEDAAKKLKAAEDRILELETEISGMSDGVAMRDERIDALTAELRKSEEMQSALRRKQSFVKMDAASAESVRMENDDLRREIEALRMENGRLRIEVKGMSADRESVEDLKRRLAIAESQRSKAMCMLNEAEDRMEYLGRNSRVRMAAEPCDEPAQPMVSESVRVTRTDRNCLSSPVFGYKCYSVKMNMAKTTMLITPSNDGKVLCRDYVLEISGLGHLLPFNGTEDLRAETVAGTKSIKVMLGGS